MTKDTTNTVNTQTFTFNTAPYALKGALEAIHEAAQGAGFAVPDAPQVAVTITVTLEGDEESDVNGFMDSLEAVGLEHRMVQQD
jgi:hypothetical protein